LQLLRNWLEEIQRILSIPLLRIGESEFTLWIVLQFLILLLVLFYVSLAFKGIILKRLLPRSRRWLP
jgi:hypothetical protein